MNRCYAFVAAVIAGLFGLASVRASSAASRLPGSGFLPVGPASAQIRDTLNIRGIVVEPGANLGVAAAEVTLYEFVRDPERSRVIFATAVTDLRGAFQFHPVRFGDYYVEVSKPGYVSAYSINGPSTLQESTGTLLRLSPDRRSQEVRLSLMRPGELTGRVIDEAGNPAAGVRVEVLTPGSSILFAGAVTSTDKDGSFTARRLRPGEYFARISPGLGGLATAVQRFSDDDLMVVDQDLATTYWPGGLDERSASPVLVSPGSSASVGTITAVKTPYYRVRVSVSGDCRPDDKEELFIFDASGPSVRFHNSASFFSYSFSPLPCKDFLVRDLLPGSYQFALRNTRGWAIALVNVTTSNLDIPLTFTPDVDMYGRVIAAEGASLPSLDDVRIELRPAIDMAGRYAGPAPSPVADGRFLFRNVGWPRHMIIVHGLGNRHYVREIRADGRTEADGIVTPSQGSQLEIVVDDKPAVLTGSVTDGNNPVSRPIVYLTKWPMPPLSALNAVITVTGDSDGRFAIVGLAPGEYRVLALPSVPLADGLELTKDIVPRLWHRADQLTLERGRSKNLSLKPADPWR